MNIEYKINTASRDAIIEHLNKCSSLFIPPLDTYVVIEEYGRKIFEKAKTFEAWDGHILAGLAAAYFNDFTNKKGFLTNLSLLNEYQHQGIASQLIFAVIEYGRNNDFESINLEVKSINEKVYKFYAKHGFIEIGQKNDCYVMNLRIGSTK